MRIENFNATRIMDTLYKNEVLNTDNDVIYCELQYQRDRSSFAGIALKITDKKSGMVVRKCEEKIKSVSKYEKMYIGYEQAYVDAIEKIYFLNKRKYGIEILFLVYSDVRSSQIIFEELMKSVDENINIIKGLK